MDAAHRHFTVVVVDAEVISPGAGLCGTTTGTSPAPRGKWTLILGGKMRLRLRSFLALFALTPGLLTQAGVATSRPTSTARSVATTVGEAMARQGLVGISIAWIEAGKLAATRSFGFADREHKITASDATLYRWASISKPITAVVAMQLHEAGKLDLDADVHTLVEEWPKKPWPVTARQLLTHQGGIVHYANGKIIKRERHYEQEHPFEDVVKALDVFADSPLICEPGTKHSYTTHGYMLLGAVVQRAGGESYWKQVKARVADPLQMTTFQPDYQWVAIQSRAVGYRKLPNLPAVPSTDTDVSWKLPGGGFVSNVGDLGRFGAALLRGELVTRASRDLMWTPMRTKAGVVTGYGLGFGVRGKLGEAGFEVAHSGSQEKTATLLVLRPVERRGIAIMCNTEGAELGVLAQDLLAIPR